METRTFDAVLVTAPTGLAGLGPICMLEPHLVVAGGPLGDRIYMYDTVSLADPNEISNWSDLKSLLSPMFPGYDRVFSIEVLESPCAAHRQRQVQFIKSMAVGGVPLSCGRLAGISGGELGVLFVDSGLGPPREEYTPTSILFRSWVELRDVVECNVGDEFWNHVYLLPEGTYFKGTYAVAGFPRSEIPAWLVEKSASTKKGAPVFFGAASGRMHHRPDWGHESRPID
jgi:hypothetical protein